MNCVLLIVALTAHVALKVNAEPRNETELEQVNPCERKCLCVTSSIICPIQLHWPKGVYLGSLTGDQQKFLPDNDTTSL